jgi:hypothetical protein
MIERERQPSPAAAIQAAANVDRDAKKPRREFALGVEPPQVFLEPQINLLRRVLGVFVVLQHAVGDAKNAMLVKLQQRFKSSQIARLRPPHQRRQVYFGRVCIIRPAHQ